MYHFSSILVAWNIRADLCPSVAVDVIRVVLILLAGRLYTLRAVERHCVFRAIYAVESHAQHKFILLIPIHILESAFHIVR